MIGLQRWHPTFWLTYQQSPIPDSNYFQYFWKLWRWHENGVCSFMTFEPSRSSVRGRCTCATFGNSKNCIKLGMLWCGFWSRQRLQKNIFWNHLMKGVLCAWNSLRQSTGACQQRENTAGRYMAHGRCWEVLGRRAIILFPKSWWP